MGAETARKLGVGKEGPTVRERFDAMRAGWQEKAIGRMGELLDKYRSLSRKLSSMGFDPTDAMDPYTERIDLFHSRTNGLDWYETVLKLYLTLGLLEEFYRKLAAGLPGEVRADVEKALNDKTIEKFSKKVLSDAMAKDATLGSRLALWGRRIMGDVILELRAAVPAATLEELEPLIAELNGPHSLRMDAIGLAA